MLAIIFLFLISTTKAIIYSTLIDPIVNVFLGGISKWLEELFTAFKEFEQNAEKLKSKLESTDKVLLDAGGNNRRQPESEALRNWHMKIKNAATEGQELLNNYEEAQKGNDIFRRFWAAHRTKELLERFDDIARDKDQFDLTAPLFHGESYRDSLEQISNLNSNEVSLDENTIMRARSLKITWGNTSENWTWKWITIRNDEKIEVAKLLKVYWLEVKGKIEMSELCSGVEYEVAYEVKLTNDAKGWQHPITLNLKLHGDIVRTEQVTILQKPREQWFELIVGKFLAEDSGTVHFHLKNVDTSFKKRGLVIKGVVVRKVIN